MICFHCGKEIKDNAQFCPYCGKTTAINTESVPSPPAEDESLDVETAPMQEEEPNNESASTDQEREYSQFSEPKPAIKKNVIYDAIEKNKNLSICAVVGIAALCIVMGVAIGKGSISTPTSNATTNFTGFSGPETSATTSDITTPVVPSTSEIIIDDPSCPRPSWYMDDGTPVIYVDSPGLSYGSFPNYVSDSFKKVYDGHRVCVANIPPDGIELPNEADTVSNGKYGSFIFTMEKENINSFNDACDQVYFAYGEYDLGIIGTVTNNIKDTNLIIMEDCETTIISCSKNPNNNSTYDVSNYSNQYSMRDFIANPTRFLYDHDGERIMLTGVEVGSIEQTYVTGLTAGDASSISDAWDMSWTQVYFSFDDFKSSGAYYLEENQVISVIGTISGDYLTYDMYMYDCEFITG